MKSSAFMRREVFFRKCAFCNIFEATFENPSGEIWHSHDYTQIWFVTKGQCEHYVENHFYRMAAGDAFLVPPKMEHRTVLCPASAVISCELSLEDVLPAGIGPMQNDLQGYLNLMSVMHFLQDSKDRQPRFRFRSEVIPRVNRLMQELLEEFETESPCYQDILRLKIQELLLLFIREFIISPDYQATDATYERYRILMEQAIAYVDEHYAEPISLEDICKVSSLSKTYFCYLFKLITKKTFVEYLTDCRIHEAMRQLEKTNCSITTIGAQLGFKDAAHFSRTFRKTAGISPREYRKLRNSTAKEEGNGQI